MYAFDIHCNGFFPVILFFYFGNVSILGFERYSLTFLILQALLMLFGLNKVNSDDPSVFTTFTGALLSNLLCMAGLGYYFYLLFRGYGILPFVRKPQKFLMLVPFIAIGLTAMTLLGCNSWNVLLRFTLI